MSLLTPNYQHCALLVIDFQNDFILPGAPAEIAGSYAVLPKLQQLVCHLRSQQIPIIHVVRCYLPDGSNVDLCRRTAIQQGPRFISPDSMGADFPAALKPPQAPPLDWNALLDGQFQPLAKQEWVMYKSRWGAFFHTNLEAFLHQHAINTLLFAGCNFPNCPRTTIYEASERDFRLVLAADAMSGLYEQGLRELQKIGVTVLDTDAICQAVTGP